MDSRMIAENAIRRGAIQKVGELSPLISLLKRRKLNTIVEIGSATGGTLYAWSRIAGPKASIVSIDLPNGPFSSTLNLKRMNPGKIKKAKQKLFLIRRDSHKLSTKNELLKRLNGRKIDFLFIDGDHRYRGAKKDWEMYSPLVRRGGLIALHDILCQPMAVNCRTYRLWKEIKVNNKYLEFIDRTIGWGWKQWGGIGVIHYSGAYTTGRKASS